MCIERPQQLAARRHRPARVSVSSAASVNQPNTARPLARQRAARPKVMRWPSAVVRIRPQPSAPCRARRRRRSSGALRYSGCESKLHLRAFDVHRDRQPRRPAPAPRHVGRRADLGRELVHVVADQRLGVRPASRWCSTLLHAEQEHAGHAPAPAARTAMTSRHFSEWRRAAPRAARVPARARCVQRDAAAIAVTEPARTPRTCSPRCAAS